MFLYNSNSNNINSNNNNNSNSSNNNSNNNNIVIVQSLLATPKGPKYLYGTKYGFCSSNFPYGLGKYSPYGYLGPFGYHARHASLLINEEA